MLFISLFLIFKEMIEKIGTHTLQQNPTLLIQLCVSLGPGDRFVVRVVFSLQYKARGKVIQFNLEASG